MYKRNNPEVIAWGFAQRINRRQRKLAVSAMIEVILDEAEKVLRKSIALNRKLK